MVLTSFFVTGYYLLFSDEFYDTHTSAICSGNVCRDYEFTCLNGEVVSSVPISGFVTFDENWVDLREDKDRC